MMWLIVKEIKKERHSVLSFIQFFQAYAVNPTQIESRDQNIFKGLGLKICNNCGIRDEDLSPKCGSVGENIPR